MDGVAGSQEMSLGQTGSLSNDVLGHLEAEVLLPARLEFAQSSPLLGR
jgi:hypothetical protein